KELRDPQRSLALARKALELVDAQDPNLYVFHRTLGIALVRNDEFAAAVSELERSLREGEGRTAAFDLFYLAMCQHRLGDADKARAYRTQAVRWVEEHCKELPPEWVEELTALQAEVDTVLKEPPGPPKK